MAKTGKNLYCSEFKNEENPCNFILFTNISGVKLTDSDIIDLATKGITKKKTFTSAKNGSKFQAKIKFLPDFKTTFEFEETTKKEKPKTKSNLKKKF